MTKTNDDIHVNKKYKDTVFRKLFGENKENALSLYNAVNHTSYTDPDDLEYTTLEAVSYTHLDVYKRQACAGRSH